MKNIASILVLLLVAGCASGSKNTDLTLRESLAGAWGWTSKECREGAPIHSFSEDGSTMFVSSDKGMITSATSEPKTQLVYQIIGESKNVLRTVIEGEDRFQKNGEPAVWDLVLLSNYRFCWHRTDWPAGSCTKPLRRC